MQQFNMKQWLMENKSGMYSKVNEANSADYDTIAQAEFGMDYDQLGPGEKEWVRDEAETKGSVNEIDPAALGAPQAAADAEMQQQDDENGDMVDNASMGVAAEAYGMEDMPDAEKYKIETDKGGRIISATNEDGERFTVGSLVKDNNGKDTKVLGFKQNQGKVKAITSDNGGLNVSEWDINGLTLDEVDETVGYAMITKPSDPNRREPLEM